MLARHIADYKEFAKIDKDRWIPRAIKFLETKNSYMKKTLIIHEKKLEELKLRIDFELDRENCGSKDRAKERK